MKKIAKKLSAIALCTVFATMQVAAYDMTTGDTGLGKGSNGAIINNATGGYLGTNLGKGSATLEFKGDSHVNWDTLNVDKGESLNFNAINGVNGITVVNTVNREMTNVHGAISSNTGVAKLIISNPNGMLFDGAKFTTAGDLQLTTQALAVNYLNGKLDISGLDKEATNGIVIKDGANLDKTFSVGGQFDIIAPTVEIVGGYIGATKGLNLITKDGKSYLICPKTSGNEDAKPVILESVKVDGNVYIVSGEGIVTALNGGEIKGNLTVDSQGSVGLNYNNAGKQLNVTGNVDSKADGYAHTMRNATVGGNLTMSNSGGFLEIGNVKVTGNANLTTTADDPLVKPRHFVHVVGDTEVGGNLIVDSINNIHIGGYDEDLKTIAPGSLKVGGDLNALAHYGSVAVTVDTSANNVSLTSEDLNIVTDGKATITANNYQFDAKHYIGGLQDTDYLINTVMEDYTPIGQYIEGERGYLNIAGGNVTKFHQTDNSSYAFLKSNGDMNINDIDAGNVYMTSNKDIVIGDKATAPKIQVGGETRNLTVKLPNRDYKLLYKNIKDNKVITIEGKDEITYDMANGENGWNKGTQTAENTYLVVPGGNKPVLPPVIDPEDPTKDDAEKIMRNLNRDEVASAIDAQQVMTPVAFAADLDDEIDTGVRKNVDGSVTVVRPYTPVN